MDDKFDVIVLGAGMAGSTLSTILAHHGHRVLLLERGSLPRFAIGESSLPQTSFWIWMIGAYHGLPEIQALARTQTVHDEISKSCGVKKSLAFLYHQPGEPLAPEAAYQLVPPETPFSSESHFFREDVDVYLLDVAKSKGVVYRDQTPVEGIEEVEEGIEVRIAGGETIAARYVVDATGYRSPIAQQLDLREDPPRAQTSSRSIFTHVRGLRPFDEVFSTSEGSTAGYHHGTLHHMFDGGWFWVIPFGNHDAATTDAASVGLMLDTRKYPRDPAVAPADEFASVVQRFPTIQEHLGDIQPIHDWIGTERIQYSSSRTAGDRWFLLGHAAGFIDPLYSRGLTITFETLHELSIELLAALSDDDFRYERFEALDRMQIAQGEYTDRIIDTAYRCTADVRMWSPSIQLWLLRMLFGDVWRLRTIFHFVGSGDPSVLRDVHEDPVPGAGAPYAAQMQDLVDEFHRTAARVESGEIDAAAASQAMFDALRGVEWLPRQLYRWGAEDERHLFFDLDKVGQLVMWGKTQAPPNVQKAFDFPVPPQLAGG